MPSAALIKEFEAVVGKDNVFTSEADRQSYSYDSAVLDAVVPSLVVRPTSTEQLGKVVRLCNENGNPITVRGAGTNLSGGTIPDPREGIVILTNSLNRIIEINEEDLYAVVEPGVVTAKFAAEVAKRGLFYPPDPGSQAVSTLGGNLKYGVTKDYVMGIEFFDVNGGLVKTGSRTVKCVTGYNLAGLMVASEGTLGVFSNIVLKLVPPPQASKAMMAVFDDVNKASEAVAGIIAAHVVPCTLEFMDQATIRYVDDFTKAGLPRDAQAILLIEVDGHPGQVADDAEKVEKVLNKVGATEIKGRRHRAALQDSRHGQGHQRHRGQVQHLHRHLRPRGRRQPAPHHPVRPPRQARVRARGTRRGRNLRRGPFAPGHPVGRARHRHGQVQVDGKGNLQGHHRVLAQHEARHRPQVHPESRQDHRSLTPWQTLPNSPSCFRSWTTRWSAA